MFHMTTESYVPLRVDLIHKDIDLHVRNGWNFTGVDKGERGCVLLRYSRQHGRGPSPLDPRSVANAVVDSLRHEHQLQA